MDDAERNWLWILLAVIVVIAIVWWLSSSGGTAGPQPVPATSGGTTTEIQPVGTQPAATSGTASPAY